MSKIVVTGGSGMVGRSLEDILPNAIYLSSNDYDLTNLKHVNNLFFDHEPEIVIHLAAKVGGIIDNINKPYDYFYDNIQMNTNLVDGAAQYGTKRFIGILSTCIYPDVNNRYPMEETDLHSGAPTKTNFSYGYAKRALAVQIDAMNQQYGTNYQYLIPCNLYGEYDKWGENSHFVAALLKKIILAERNKNHKLELFGTGKPLRQFMYARDFAQIIKQCLDNEIYDSFNVAPNENLSIKEIAEIALNVINPKHIKEVVFDPNMPDGQYRKDVSNDKLKVLFPDFKFTKLSDGILKTYNYIKDKI